MSSIKVLQHGLLDTIQDRGRFGYQQYGISPSGAADLYSYRLANILVNGDQDQAVLEITMTGPKLYFAGDTVLAITGAEFQPTLNGKNIPMNKCIRIRQGDTLELGTARRGMRGYIALAGGITTPPRLGSRSTYLTAGLGGLNGKPLRAGDVIPIGSLPPDQLASLAEKPALPASLRPKLVDDLLVRVVWGPEVDRFPADARQAFLDSDYQLTAQSDRMGLRLEGTPLRHRENADILSAGLSLGTVQVPGHGQPIIMMSDRQTTGGYARIANVISVDIPKLAQLRPGERLRFAVVEIDQAQALLREQEDQLQEFIVRYKTSDSCPTPNRSKFQIILGDREYQVTVEDIE